MGKIKAILQTLLSLMQTATGLIMVLFASVHLLGISTINFGAKWFDWYAAHLDKTNLVVKISVFLIFGIILIHGLNGLKTAYGYFFRLPKVHRHLSDMKYRGSYLWYAHFLSGIIMIGFIFFHLYMNYFGMRVATAAGVKDRLQNPFYMLLMTVFLISLVFHSIYGIRIFFIKYGLWLNGREKIDRILLIIGVAAILLGVINLSVFIR